MDSRKIPLEFNSLASQYFYLHIPIILKRIRRSISIFVQMIIKKAKFPHTVCVCQE